MWLTFNEPSVFLPLGYSTGEHAPGIKDTTGTKVYIGAHHVILSHVRAFHIYNAKYRSTQNGMYSYSIWNSSKILDVFTVY